MIVMMLRPLLRIRGSQEEEDVLLVVGVQKVYHGHVVALVLESVHPIVVVLNQEVEVEIIQIRLILNRSL
jgi:hypothetical protein